MIRVDIAVEHEPFPVAVGRLRTAVRRITQAAGKPRGPLGHAGLPLKL